MNITIIKKHFIAAAILTNLLYCTPESKSTEEHLPLLLLMDREPSQAQAGRSECALRENTIQVITAPPSIGTQVDASSTRCWMLVGLRAGGVQVGPGGDWDLRFRRFVIGTNSGLSGSGKGGACDTGSANYDSITTSSRGSCSDPSHFQVDSIQTQSGTGGFADVNDSASPVLFQWYNYANTVLTAKNNVYIIRGGDGTSLFKLQMTNYYSQAGTSGYPRFRWAAL